MGFMDSIKKAFIEQEPEAENTKTINTSETIAMNDLVKFLNLEGTDPDTLSEATYYACIKVLSEAVGKLPLKLQRDTDKGIISAKNDPLYHTIGKRPNPYMTSTTFWSTMEANRNHYGNAYAAITGAGAQTQLWILPSKNVRVVVDNAKKLSDVSDIYYIYTQGAKQYTLKSEEVIHLKTSNTFDGIVGIPVQEQLATSIKGNAKAQALTNAMYDSGFTAKAVLQYTGSLNDDSVKKLTKGIQDYAQGKVKGVESIIPIPLGFQLTPLNTKLTDSQFIEVKQYTALQIASAFGIKPYQIGDYTKSSYASAEAQQLSFYIDTLLYIIKQYEEELNYKLLTPSKTRRGFEFKFNVGVILRADFKSQIETLTKAVNSFLMTPDEARVLIDLPNKPGGDQLIGNGAAIPLELVGTQYGNNSEAPPGEEPEAAEDDDGKEEDDDE